jgi:hypothetical protein
MKSIQENSAHRHDGWQGQYNRMMRWTKWFKELAFKENKSCEKTHLYFDTMYACFQNIFFLKDWLIQETSLTTGDLNSFIKAHKEIGVCRDICNGTKHFNITDESVDKEFWIIRQFNPYNRDISEWEIIICAGVDIYKPYELIVKCIDLWEKFISDKLNLEKKI